MDSEFIAKIASIVKPTTYVELGLCFGETFEKVLPYTTRAYGVDITPHENLRKLEANSKVSITYDTTDNFFLNFHEPIDLALIDADHTATSALRDFEHTLNLLSDKGVILMHDTDPISEEYEQPKYCGDSYKLVPLLEARTDINIVTLPLLVAGLSLITKKNSTRSQIRHHIIS